MPAEVNGNHVIAHYNRARVFVKHADQYDVCGSVVITPFFVFVSGHKGADDDFEPVVSNAILREHIRFIVDHSVEACETHDTMDAEAKAQMETASAEESQKD